MKDATQLDLNDIPYFVEAAENGSFSAAARMLGVPPSVVSRKIARLEGSTGVRLFQRTTRSLALTDAGQSFLDHAKAALESVARAQQSTREAAGAVVGRVRLSAAHGAASALRPVLSRFLERHPGVSVELVLADRYVDLVEERIDLAIRAGASSHAPTLIGRQITTAPRCFFASPGYLASHGRPRSVAELKDHACVIIGPRADRAIWRVRVGSRQHSVVVRGRIAVNEALVAADCTADGLGIGFLPSAVCTRHLDGGTLVRILPRATGAEAGLWLVYPDRRLPAVTRAMVDFLMAELPKAMNALVRS